jgi:lipoprotein-releasing system ATP-binding protein
MADASAQGAAQGPVLQAEGLGRDFGALAVTRALDSVSLTLARGEFAALIGPSGSGKSTLLNLLGLLDRPTRGRVLLDGQDTSSLDDAALTALRGQMLGFVFQSHLLLPAFTALENVLLPGWAAEGRPAPALRERAGRLLGQVGLGDRLHSKVSELSGGQQQRVAIARALAGGARLVLADEPTGNLDTESSKGVFTLLRALNRELQTTFLIVTHDLRIAGQCDRVIEIVDGRIQSDRTQAAPPQ